MKNRTTVIITLILLAITQVNCHRDNYAVRMLNSIKAGDEIQIYRSQYIIPLSLTVAANYVVLYPSVHVCQWFNTPYFDSTFGNYTIDNDTIKVTPVFNLYKFSENREIRGEVFSPDSIPSIESIPRKYLMKDGNLIDMTTYGAIYLNEPPYSIIMDSLWRQTREVFTPIELKSKKRDVY